MNANDIYSELKKNGFNVKLDKQFSYEVNKNNCFNTVIVIGTINKEIISIVHKHKCMLVAETYVDVSGDTPVCEVKHTVYPRDMKSFDWICE